MTEAELKRIQQVRWWARGNAPATEKITREDVVLLVKRIEDLDLEEFHCAEEIVRFMLGRLEEDLRNSRDYLADQIEMTRIAELQVREAEKARDAVNALIDGGMFTSGAEVNQRWDAMTELYRAQGMLPEPEAPAEPPTEAAQEEPAPEPAPEPVEPPAEPEDPGDPPPYILPPEKVAWGTHTRKRDAAPKTPEDPVAAVFASLKAAAGDQPEIQVSLAVIAAHSGVPKGSLIHVLRTLQDARRIEIISSASHKGAKPPNTYRFVVEAAPAPEPPETEEPAQVEAPSAADAEPVKQRPIEYRPPAPFARASKVTDSSPIRDRIINTLRKAACTTSGLASMLDIKELHICQTLTAMEHEGAVKPDEMPEAGRRAQLWRLAPAA